MACNGHCEGCASDCGKQPLRHPNITGAILGQFMMDMAHRVQEQEAGRLTEEKLDEIDRKTMNWLGATFSGQNSQFEVDPEWYPNGVGGNLRFKLGEELVQAAGGKLPEDNTTLIYSAFAVFMAEVYNTLYELAKKGIEPLGEVPAPEMLALLKRWTEILVGYEVKFRDPSAKDDEESTNKSEQADAQGNL